MCFSVLTKQGISYAKLANLPPIVGLCKWSKFKTEHSLNLDSFDKVLVQYFNITDFDLTTDSSFVPPLIYSVLGSSRHLAVGPVSIASLVMGTMLSETVSYAEEPILYLQLAFTATFFAGLFQASLGFLRWLVQFTFVSKWERLLQKYSTVMHWFRNK